jgi:hypothetical protein
MRKIRILNIRIVVIQRWFFNVKASWHGNV